MSETKQPECNVLQWFDPGFATQLAADCAAHDDAYHEASARAAAGLPRGSRFPADFRQIAAMAEHSTWRAFFYGGWLLLFGWVLWYDLDEAPRHAVKAVGRWVSVKG
jgi:hypothetical protein